MTQTLQEAIAQADYVERLETLNAELLNALQDCADDLAAELNARYGEPVHPGMLRRYERDMASVESASILIAKAKGETVTPEEKVQGIINASISHTGENGILLDYQLLVKNIADALREAHISDMEVVRDFGKAYVDGFRDAEIHYEELLEEAQQPRWIPVGEDMHTAQWTPEYGSIIAFQPPQGVYEVDWEDEIAEGRSRFYTHWQHLPEPPKTEAT